MHPDVDILNNVKAKPETVTFYNKTKAGVDKVDQMARKYSVKSASRRWPFHTFCKIFDLAGINARVLYKQVTDTNISRRDFLLGLGEELAKALLEKRNPSVPHALISAVSQKRRRCQVQISCKQKTEKGEVRTVV